MTVDSEFHNHEGFYDTFCPIVLFSLLELTLENNFVLNSLNTDLIFIINLLLILEVQ